VFYWGVKEASFFTMKGENENLAFSLLEGARGIVSQLVYLVLVFLFSDSNM
jgi:hypothetical protein